MAASKNVLTATDTNFDSDVLKSDKLALVDFWAEWCGPCKYLAPTMDALADQFSTQVKVYKLNVDENPNVATRFNIRGIPTVLFIKNGQVIDQLVGNQPKEIFEQAIQKNLA